MDAMLCLGPGLYVPLDVVTYTTGILGVRGTGKTNTATVIVEEALSHHQPCVVIDPLDVWWGLKSSKDGKSEGYPVAVLGGDHGDLPLSETSGEAVAELIVRRRVPAVLSIAHMRKGQQARFVADFCERLYSAQNEKRQRITVVIDEASSFVPQAFQGDLARCVGAVEDLVRRGRARGIGVVLVDQRAASVNKNVLTQLELLIAHRQTSPQDRAAIKAWVEASDDADRTKSLVASLAHLGKNDAVGEAWVWSPLLDLFERARIRERRTFDSSRTPGAGEALAPPSALSSVDVEALREALAIEAPKDAVKGGSSDADVARAVEAATRPLLDRLTESEAHWRELYEIGARLSTIAAVALGIDSAAKEEASLEIPVQLRPPSPTPQKAKPPAVRDEKTPRPQQAILDALGALEGVGLRAPQKAHVALFAGVSPRSSGFANNLGAMRSAGLIAYPSGGTVALTSAGRERAADVPHPPRLAELHERWFSILTNPQSAILRALIARYPNPIGRDDLALASGVSAASSGYANNLGHLRSLGLLDYPERGTVAATPLLFPEGLR